MKERQLKTTLAVCIVAINIFTVALVFVCFEIGGFDEDQLTTLLAIIFPMFSCYSVSAIRHIISDRKNRSDSRKNIPATLSILAFGIIFSFAFFIVAIIIMQAQGNVFPNFEYFKKVLLYMETAFAGLIGATIYPMFPYRGNEGSSVTRDAE